MFGGLTENMRFSPTDYSLDTNLHPTLKRDFNTLLWEIKVLCRHFNVRKVNIIDSHLSKNLTNLKKVIEYLDTKRLSYVKIGLLLELECLSQADVYLLKHNYNSIFKISLLSNYVDSRQIELIQSMTIYNWRIKLCFELFNKNSNVDDVCFVLNQLRKGMFSISPNSLIKGSSDNQVLNKTQTIIALLYYRVFYTFHQKIIQYENQNKYELRSGISKNYHSIPHIQKQIDKMSNLLMSVFLDVIESTICHCLQTNLSTKEIILLLLEQFHDQILCIEGDFDAHLSDPYRV